MHIGGHNFGAGGYRDGRGGGGGGDRPAVDKMSITLLVTEHTDRLRQAMMNVVGATGVDTKAGGVLTARHTRSTDVESMSSVRASVIAFRHPAGRSCSYLGPSACSQ